MGIFPHHVLFHHAGTGLIACGTVDVMAATLPAKHECKDCTV